mgnify:CR=1 FL=1
MNSVEKYSVVEGRGFYNISARRHLQKEHEE